MVTSNRKTDYASLRNNSSEHYSPWPVVTGAHSRLALDFDIGAFGTICCWGLWNLNSVCDFTDKNGNIVWEASSYWYSADQLQEAGEIAAGLSEWYGTYLHSIVSNSNDMGWSFWLLMLVEPDSERTSKWVEGNLLFLGPLLAYFATIFVEPNGMIELFSREPAEIMDTRLSFWNRIRTARLGTFCCGRYNRY